MAHHDYRRQGEFDQQRRPPSPYGGERGPSRAGPYRGGGDWQGEDDHGRSSSWIGDDDGHEAYGASGGYGGHGAYGGYTDALGSERGYGERSSHVQRGYGPQQGGFGEREPRTGWGREGQGMGRDDGGPGPQRSHRQGGQGWQDAEAQPQRQEFDADYRQWRSDQMQRLDNDYRSWRDDRYKKFSEEFSTWRKNRTSDTERSDNAQTGGDTATLAAANKETKDGPKNRV